jgi:hypothetical protein
MAKRTQIVCLHEGKKGRSIDPIFANSFLKAYDPEWLRPWSTGIIRFVPCGGKSELLKAFPSELRICEAAGGNTTLMVLADIDDDIESPESLKKKYRDAAKADGLSNAVFEKTVFIFAKDRIENWVEFLIKGTTDENREGQRIKEFSTVREAAKKLAKNCHSNSMDPLPPPSLQWSCGNWRALVERMR